MSNAEPLAPPTPQSESSAAVPGASGRLICLDIFRGLAVAGMILVDNPGSDEKVYRPIAHAEWNGWTPADFIFPSFLFLVGVSLVFSFAKRRERGDSRGQILLHVFIRSLLLIVIGLLVNASPFIGVDFHALRFEGVTQRIALCYFAAAILELWSDRRGKSSPSLSACSDTGRFCGSFRCRASASLAATFRSWIPIEIWRRGWTANFSWGIFSTARATLREFSAHPGRRPTLLGVLTGHWLRSQKSPATKAHRDAARRNLRLGRGRSLEHLVSDQQKSLDQFVCTFQRRLRTGFSRDAVLDVGNQALARRVDHSHSRLRNECDRGICGRFVGVRPRLHFHRQTRGRNHVSWHDAAQAKLVSLGASPPNASLIYSLGAVTILLDSAVVALAQAHFSEGLIPQQSAGNILTRRITVTAPRISACIGNSQRQKPEEQHLPFAPELTAELAAAGPGNCRNTKTSPRAFSQERD